MLFGAYYVHLRFWFILNLKETIGVGKEHIQKISLNHRQNIYYPLTFPFSTPAQSSKKCEKLICISASETLANFATILFLIFQKASLEKNYQIKKVTEKQ